MARPSAIDRLPEPTRRLIKRRRRAGRSIDAIRTELAGLGVAVGRSTLARHTRQLDAASDVGFGRELLALRAELRGLRGDVAELLARAREADHARPAEGD